jgi:hypothetical protein
VGDDISGHPVSFVSFLKWNLEKVISRTRRIDRKLLMLSQRRLRIILMWTGSTHGFVIILKVKTTGR